MGDMADMINECGFDEDDWENERALHDVKCKYCGKSGFQWINIGSDIEPKWRLADQHMKWHFCKKYVPQGE